MALPPLVLIHGANGSAESIEPLAVPLRAHARVFVPDLPGHGKRPREASISVQGAATDLLALLDREGIERAIFVGYSVGGYVAMWLARNFPGRTLGVCTLGTRFNFDPETVSFWMHLAHPDRMARPGNPRGPEMLALHGEDWRLLTAASAAMCGDLGRDPPLRAEDFAAITCPVMLVNSNRDTFAPWEETLEIGTRIPGAKLVMFYGLAHPIRNVPIAQVVAAMAPWIAEVGGT